MNAKKKYDRIPVITDYIKHAESLMYSMGDPEIIDEESIIKKSTLLEIWYDVSVGIGYVNNRKFKFKDNQPEYKLFSELYKKLNKKVARGKVLNLIGFYKTKDPSTTSKIAETYAINRIAVKIRSKLKISPEQLILSNGNLTLFGNKTNRD